MKNKHFAVLMIALLGANYAVQKDSEGNTKDSLHEAIAISDSKARWFDYHNAVKQRRATVQACFRTNVPRQQLYGFLIDARQRNIDSMPGQTGEEAAATRMAITQYTARARRLIHATQPYQFAPRSPQLACEEALPPPKRPRVPKPSAFPAKSD